MKPCRWISLVCLTFAVAARTDASQPTNTTAVLDWNAFATELFVAAPQPPLDTRIYSIQHAAIHDALNTIRKRYKFYTGECRGTATDPSAASVDAAVAAAARDVLVAQLPASQSTIDDKYHEALAAIPDGTAELDGIAIGQACAAAILARRADDGLATVGPPVPCPPGAECPEYVPTGEPGDYQFTPPFDAPPLGPLAALPGYGNLETFIIKLSNHKLAGPLRLKSLAYAADFNYLKAIGRSDSTLRTAEQSEIAEFWYEASGVGWNRIANTVIRDAGLDAWKAARIFTLMNFALSDGYVAHFDVKYHYRFWRPITAIRQAAVDGNLFTEPDEAWTPFLETPPIPDYPSGHTVVGASAAAVLTEHLGDDVHFDTTSTTRLGVTRSFTSFTHAAIENGWSRVFAGIHFVHAVADGYKQGQKIGREVAKKLPPAHR